MTPKISIIVPIYNAEIYLRRCIDSILSQNFQDFEILLIDDGSPDKSGNICDEYATKDNRIRVFHKENGGVSSARQYGINNAKGEYTIHIDPDDWVESNMLYDLYEKSKKEDADIVICDFYIEGEKNATYKKQYIGNTNQNTLKNILNGKVIGTLWNKLIKNNLYRKYNIHFIQDINYCEDVLILAQLLIIEHLKVSYLNKALYHYNITNNNSITQNFTPLSYRYRKKYILTLEKILPNDYKDNINQAALDVKFEAFANNILPKNDYYYFRPHSIKDIINSRLSIKAKLFFIMSSVGLFELSIHLYKTLKHLKNIYNQHC